ncbi:LysR family transcriptional regulator [Rhodobaculum claviforme]|nr:LysR family transcriptional regulator [Rhodobaculum claviforme]
MKLRQLELLRAVIRCETTVRAAHELGLSQPAVSNAIKHMESQLGFALFERVNNRLFATPEAMMIFRETEHLFDVYQALEARISDMRKHRLGSIRILASPPLGHSVIPLALRSFLAQSPGVAAHFDICSYSSTLASVGAGTAELGFVLGAGDDTGLCTEVFFSEPLVCIMPPEHPLATLPEVAPADIAGHSFVALQPDTRMGEMTRAIFRDCDVPFAFDVEVRYCNTACILVQAGVGVALVDALSALTCAGDRLTVRPVVPSHNVVASAVWSPKTPLSKSAAQFLRHVSRQAQGFMSRRAAL